MNFVLRHSSFLLELRCLLLLRCVLRLLRFCHFLRPLGLGDNIGQLSINKEEPSLLKDSQPVISPFLSWLLIQWLELFHRVWRTPSIAYLLGGHTKHYIAFNDILLYFGRIVFYLLLSVSHRLRAATEPEHHYAYNHKNNLTNPHHFSSFGLITIRMPSRYDTFYSLPSIVFMARLIISAEKPLLKSIPQSLFLVTSSSKSRMLFIFFSTNFFAAVK